MGTTNCWKIKQSMLICKQYDRLINSYLLDFFTEDHWNLLSNSWKDFFGSISFSDLGQILNGEERLESNKIILLSVLALNTLLKQLNLPRQSVERPDTIWDTFHDMPGFQSIKANSNMFWKHVKLKKRHEIITMSKVTYDCAKSTNCLYIVDIGSGLGHFLRALKYIYGLKTCGIEMKESLTEQAMKLDRNFEASLSKQKMYCPSKTLAIHVNKRIDETITGQEFICIIKSAFGIIKSEDFRFGIVGLHPCGDLGPILLRLFTECPEAKFINVVGCCYMKLSTISQEGYNKSYKVGFPMSEYYLENNYSLRYNSLEIACHAIENYISKLKSGDIYDLQIHCYRAVLEKLLKIHHPEFCHRQLGNVKFKNNLTFYDYYRSALRGYPDINIENDILNSVEVKGDLNMWQQVVVFYSLRLLFAPLVESVILYDRLLFLQRIGKCEIISEFDPRLSPRNQVIVCIKDEL